MKTNLLSSDKDPMGTAIADYFNHNKADKLRVFSSQFEPHFLETFDTILMLMNGSGIIGKLENMAAFFQKMKQLLRPGGCILMDSSDLRYLFEDEDGSFLIDLAGDYYGEIDFRMQYKNIKGDSFDWLYVDFQTLSLYAAGNGFEAELIKEGEHYDYLTRLRWKG